MGQRNRADKAVAREGSRTRAAKALGRGPHAHDKRRTKNYRKGAKSNLSGARRRQSRQEVLERWVDTDATEPPPAPRFAHGIEVVAGRCSGQPVIAGTRLHTATIWSCFVVCLWSLETIASEYPSVTPAQIQDALRFECALRAKIGWAIAVRDGR